MLTIAEQIAQVTAEVTALHEHVKEKKAELKNLNDAKDEEDRQYLMAAMLASGRSVDNVVAIIGGAE